MKITITATHKYTIETKQDTEQKKKSPAPQKQVQSNSPKNTIIINHK